jgi:hypothetical protein
MWMLILAGACHDSEPSDPDLATAVDLSAVDDLAVVDLAAVSDLSVADLAHPDLSPPFCVGTALFVPGAGANPPDMASLPPDGGGDPDAGTGPVDMTAPRAIACGWIYDCLFQGKSPAVCAAQSPPASRQKWDDLLFCWRNTCNSVSVSSCDNCINNTQSDSPTMPTFFVDGTGMPLQCLADGTIPTGGKPAGDCGSCLDKAYACIFECYSDADCAQLTHSDGTPATCDLTTGQCV